MKHSPQRERVRGALSPAVVFVVLILLVGAGAIYALTRTSEPAPDPAISSEPSPSPTNHQLTDAEAIAEFRKLDKLRQRAFEERDPDLVDEVFTPSSPSAPTLKKTIQRFLREGVIANERLRVLRERVLKNAESEIRIEQVIVLDIVFRDEEGRNVTRDGGLERQKVRWVLRHDDSVWQLHDGLIVAARPVR